jgi:hypothetical protein
MSATVMSPATRVVVLGSIDRLPLSSLCDPAEPDGAYGYGDKSGGEQGQPTT